MTPIMVERFAPLKREELEDRQRAIFDAIESGPRGSVPWIFHLFLQSPELASRVQALGAFCRYNTGLPPHLSELAILVVARHWEADYEWSAHEGEARKAGVPDAVIVAIKSGKTPTFVDTDSSLVYEFCSTYLRTNDIPDPLFAQAIRRLGRPTVVELAGLVGYYTMLAMAMRIFRLPPES